MCIHPDSAVHLGFRNLKDSGASSRFRTTRLGITAAKGDPPSTHWDWVESSLSFIYAGSNVTLQGDKNCLNTHIVSGSDKWVEDATFEWRPESVGNWTAAVEFHYFYGSKEYEYDGRTVCISKPYARKWTPTSFPLCDADHVSS